MDKLFDPGFWTMRRRSWLYSIVSSAVPLLVAIGFFTNDVAQLALNVAAAILAVSSGTMALGNLTPDNVIKVGVEMKKKEEDAVQG